MVNLKNYNVVLKHFVLLLTFSIVVSCAKQNYAVTKIEGKKIEISNKQSNATEPVVGETAKEIESFIKPYREKVDKDLSEILAYCPETLDKSKGEWQTVIGSFLADITLEKTNKIFQTRENKSIDICILNHGGIRSIIPKGNVTARTAFEVMPFENTSIVIALKGEQILEMTAHFVTEKKPHPLSGITFTIEKDKSVSSILIQGKPLDVNKIYYIVTSDYLSNGGDNMNFFKKGIAKFDLDYKLRNILIDYFKEVDTLKINNDIRIKVGS